MLEGKHAELLNAAVATDGTGFAAMLAGRSDEGRRRMADAAALYRASWEAAPPRSYGRLVAYLKSAVLSGDAAEAADYVVAQLAGACDSPTSCYAVALAALLRDDDATAADAAGRMGDGGDAFARAGEALGALAARDASRYATAVAAIVADFESRAAHLTGVPIADTAMLMEALAEPRGLAVHPASELVPTPA
jgi:hypothetical protein